MLLLEPDVGTGVTQYCCWNLMWVLSRSVLLLKLDVGTESLSVVAGTSGALGLLSVVAGT